MLAFVDPLPQWCALLPVKQCRGARAPIVADLKRFIIRSALRPAASLAIRATGVVLAADCPPSCQRLPGSNPKNVVPRRRLCSNCHCT